ncbi:MAG: hypothetical protein JWO59_2211, partial [Chloroflexi bacterium]|nr:hypothetical protein [Chloroflexota bacterium]
MRSTNQLKQRLSTSTVRTAYALVVRGVILLSLVWAVLGQHPSPAVVAAGSASGQSDVRADTGPIAETVVRLSAEPVAFADAAKTRRVFVATTDPHDQNRAGVVVLDAASGKVLNSVSLRVPGARAGQAGGGPSPVGIACPGCVAVDRRSGRVFVLTSGPLDRAGNPTGFPRMFVLDATTGKVVGTSALTAHRATLNLPTGVVVDERSNRVFVGYGDSE